jgi:peptidyl-prolyl cis-trans isomerase A (cyclophilin A)
MRFTLSSPRSAPFAVAAYLLIASACGDQQPAPEAAASACPPAAAPAAADTMRVCFDTSAGTIIAEFYRDWAPNGYARVQELIDAKHFDNARFFRVVPGFVAQFGMHADPMTNAEWQQRSIPDDPVTQSNVRGTITFAAASTPNSRSSQLFINLVDNTGLDSRGFAPVGRIIDGVAVIDSLYGGYGESPNQGSIGAEGNAYLQREFPQLDYIRTATVVAR